MAQSVQRLCYELFDLGFAVKFCYSPKPRHPASSLISTHGYSLGVKRPGHEVKNEGRYASVSPVCLSGVYMDKVTFLQLNPSKLATCGLLHTSPTYTGGQLVETT